jgi:homocitrate synthase
MSIASLPVFQRMISRPSLAGRVPRLLRAQSFSTASPYPAINPFDYVPTFSIKQSLDFAIVDSTLREGEQFSTAFFNTADKKFIAQVLSEIGVEYVELVTPLASKQSAEDCKALASMGLKSKIVTHVRCHMLDVKAAVDCGVDGVNMYMATSQTLRQHSHGKGIDQIIEAAKECVDYCKKHKVECRFSCEDTFRSDPTDVLKVYQAMDKLGVNRVGLADTVGVATPLQVWQTVSTVRRHVKCDIEFHVHDDTGCCIANALMAVQAGATHIDTCVLGIGERNGITPLGGFLGRMYTLDKERIRSRYNLPLLRDLEKYVAKRAQIDIPFNNYITGSAAFTHKAGVHSKAVMQNPEAYEVLDPTDFGVERHIEIAHRLTGWNAVKQRSDQLGLKLSETRIKEATSWIKNLADTQEVTTSMLDNKLRELARLA